MKIHINGEAAEVRDGLSIAELLSERRVKSPDMVAVELNGEILRRDTFARTEIRANDAIEFLYFMGGGK